MRNGQNLEQIKAALEAQDATLALDQASLKKAAERTPPAPDHSPTVEHHEEFAATSFSFEVERTENKIDAKRIQTFPKLEQERPRETKTVTPTSVGKESLRPSTPTRASPAPRTTRRGKGMTLLDRYISFVAKLLKALEKFILRRFNRGQGQPQNTQEAAETTESPLQDKPKKKIPVRHGPGI